MEEKSPFKYRCGQVVRDKITGFTGVIITRVDYLTGCVRYSVQPQTLKDDGSMLDDKFIDEAQLDVVHGVESFMGLNEGSKPAGARDMSGVRR